jgi:hypothetical protein
VVGYIRYLTEHAAAGGTCRGAGGRLRGPAQRTVTASIPIPDSIRVLIDGPD